MKEKWLDQVLMMLNEWVPSEASIAIADEHQYLHYYSGAIDLQLKRGMPLIPGSIATKVVKANRSIEEVVDQSVYGEPYFGVGYPVQFDDRRFAVIVILPVSYAVKMEERPKFLTGRLDEAWFPIPLQHIIYFESFDKKTWFSTEDETYQSIYKLKELEYLLPNDFLRVHRSFIVNLHYVQEISREFSPRFQLELQNDTSIPVSQTYVPELRRKLGF